MAEEVPIASCAPECNGNVIPERGPLQAIGIIDEIAKSVGTVPYANAETGPDTPLTKETQKENRNSVAEKTIRGSSDGEKQCEEKQEENDATQQDRSADIPSQDTRTDGQKSEEGPGEAGVPGRRGERQEARSTAPAEAGRSGCAAEAEESPAAGAPTPQAKEHAEDEVWLEEGENATEEEEEEDTEEDEVQLIEIKKEHSEESRLKKQENGKEVSPPTSPTCNSQPEKPGEQPGVGKKNDISRHSYSRYNTISYRKIRKGNTKQRIDEFESMMHL
ncbi:ermin [Apteryx rowi]|uniref:ermin n=1 Tax=Apteryx rowi TaxID=308060 RepID=UPI000E1D6C51|nr:ermin [Apteryx rowi]